MSNAEYSPCELLQQHLTVRGIASVAPGGVVTGPASHEQQQQGCVVLTEAGKGGVERYVTPLQRPRINVRCLAPSVDLADQIAHWVERCAPSEQRLRLTQPSTGRTYLAHRIVVNGGPSMHKDSDVTWEGLLFVEALIDTRAVA